MRFAMYHPSRLIKNKSGKELAPYVAGIMNFTWDGRQATFYRPQGKVTDYSAAVVGENTACICFDILNAYSNKFLIEHRELFDMVIRDLLPNRLIESESLPKTATTALTKTDTCTVFHIKTTYPEFKKWRGSIEEHIYMRSVEVSLLREYEIFALPGETKIESRIKNGRCSVLNSCFVCCLNIF